MNATERDMSERKGSQKAANDKSSKERRERESKEERLQEGLEESFPASDPPSVSQTTRTGEPDEHRKPKRDKT